MASAWQLLILHSRCKRYKFETIKGALVYNYTGRFSYLQPNAYGVQLVYNIDSDYSNYTS